MNDETRTVLFMHANTLNLLALLIRRKINSPAHLHEIADQLNDMADELDHYAGVPNEQTVLHQD